MSVYGAIVAGSDVRQAVADTLAAWINSYVAEVGRQHGKANTDLPGVRSIIASPDFSTFPEDQLPALVVVAPAIVDRPHKRGDGTYRAVWGVGVGVVVTSTTKEASLDLSTLYCAAVRACLLQHPTLGGFASGVGWSDERYDEMDSDDTRTIAAGIVQFDVAVDSVTDVHAGPAAPEDPVTDPSPDWPTVETVEVTTGVL